MLGALGAIFLSYKNLNKVTFTGLPSASMANRETTKHLWRGRDYIPALSLFD